MFIELTLFLFRPFSAQYAYKYMYVLSYFQSKNKETYWMKMQVLMYR